MSSDDGKSVRPDFLSDRLNAGESLEVRAARIGVARKTLEAVERNPSRMPTVATAKKVADFYGVRVTDLWAVAPPRDEGVAA